MICSCLRTRNRFSATSVDQLPHMLACMAMFGHQASLDARPVAMAGVLRAIGIDNDVIAEQSRQVLLGGGRPAGEIVSVIG